jgi:hypothetical protein
MITLAFIPFLCPWDDIFVWIPLLTIIGVFVKKKFKWCRKSCGCHCHNKKQITTSIKDGHSYNQTEK